VLTKVLIVMQAPPMLQGSRNPMDEYKTEPMCLTSPPAILA